MITKEDFDEKYGKVRFYNQVEGTLHYTYLEECRMRSKLLAEIGEDDFQLLDDFWMVAEIGAERWEDFLAFIHK